MHHHLEMVLSFGQKTDESIGYPSIRIQADPFSVGLELDTISCSAGISCHVRDIESWIATGETEPASHNQTGRPGRLRHAGERTSSSRLNESIICDPREDSSKIADAEVHCANCLLLVEDAALAEVANLYDGKGVSQE